MKTPDNDTNRRSPEDRRQSDGAPPAGWKERRRTVERRLPVAGTLSEAEWLHHFEIFHRALGRPLPMAVAGEEKGATAQSELTAAD